MTKAEQRLMSSNALPSGQRLAAKLSAAALALAGLAEREGVAGASEAGGRMIHRLTALAATTEGQGADALDRLTLAWGLQRPALVRVLAAALPAIDADAAALMAALGGGEAMARVEVLEALEPGTEASLWAQGLDCDDPFIVSGLLRLHEAALPAWRGVTAGPGFWPGILGQAIWPTAIRPLDIAAVTIPCAETPDLGLVVRALEQGEACAIAVLDDSGEAGLERAVALAMQAAKRFAVFDLEGRAEPQVTCLLAHCLLRGVCPVLILPRSPGLVRLPGEAIYPAPILCVGRDLSGLDLGARGLILAGGERAGWSWPGQMMAWRGQMPGLDEAALAGFLARYPLGPMAALAVARDAARRARLAGRPGQDVALADLQAAAAARGVRMSLSAAERREPRAEWRDLVLPAPILADLRQSIRRVLDRPLAQALLPPGLLPPGQRLLFAGGPGTGKTLAAEVIARETGSALIVADTARLMSKWLGETERNLADLFRAAEESHAILFFDEADALFGKRVDTQDARDRYANIETAYLLQRIERFSGLVILATNLPGNLDDAFRRRFDAVIDFPQPEAAERLALWRRHLPAALTGKEAGVDLERLADWFALPGGLIRNAAVTTAYLAAAEGGEVREGHLHRAIAREYLKNGTSFPGLPDPLEPHSHPYPEEELHNG